MPVAIERAKARMLDSKARAAQLVGGLAILGALSGPLAAHLRLLPPLAGFALFATSITVGGLAAVVLGAVALWRSRRDAQPGDRRRAALGTTAGLFLIATGIALVPSLTGVPRIHDITTSPDRAPEFVELAVAEANRGRDLSYPDGGPSVTAAQREAYPDLAPVDLDLTSDAAWRLALKTCEELGWKVIAADLESHRIEATDESRIFRFVDDVVIEIEPRGAISTVHVRSTSRVGQSDLGANAERIRRFLAALQAAR